MYITAVPVVRGRVEVINYRKIGHSCSPSSPPEMQPRGMVHVGVRGVAQEIWMCGFACRGAAPLLPSPGMGWAGCG